MPYGMRLVPSAITLGLLLSGAASAVTPLKLNQSSLKNIQDHFVINDKKQPVMMQKETILLQKTHTDKQHVSHARYQQYYYGIKVFGGHAILHSKAAVAHANALGRVNGRLYLDLSQTLGQPSADLLKNKQAALDAFSKRYPHDLLSEQRVSPLVFIDENNKAHWAYEVSVLVTYANKIPQRPTAIIDAKTYQPFVKWNNIKTLHEPAKGIGFGGNVKVGKTEYGKHLPALDITRDDASGRCFMETADIKIVDMEHRTSHAMLAASFPCYGAGTPADHFWTGLEKDGYDEVNGAYSPINDAMYTGMVIKRLYRDWYNVDALVKANGSAMQLVMRVHYSEDYENAFWDGRKMTFGDGGSWLYPLVSLSVGAHEISHGFTEQHSDLYYFGQSGGMNESFSDMAGMAAEYYSLGESSWLMGAEIVKEAFGKKALRFMDVPSKDGRSIDTAADYKGGLNVHYSSGVFNRLFYLMSTTPGWDPRKAFDVMVKANMDYWSPYSSFEEGGCGVFWASQDLGYSEQDVIKALDKVALSVGECRQDA